MITKRIGNDIPIEWTIIRCGEPEDLVGKRFSLYLYSFAGKVEIEDYVVSGNRIRFVFQGAQQIYAGIYGLLLVENEGEDGMYTIDHCQAFKLISHGYGECECSDGVTVTSDIAIPANGLSAYQIALKNGYVGTEEEWLESLKADSDSSEKIKEHNESESAHPFFKGLIDGKVDRKSGYGLSKNDFTDLLKAKLEGLQNYDDSEVRSLVAEIQKELDTLVEGDTQGVIDSFNEMEAFLQGITETETLTGLLEQLKTSLEEQISQKVDKEAGKGLSSNDYTDEEKVKLAGLENYDDTEVRGQIEKNKSDILEHDSQIEELRSTKQSVFKTNGLTEFISGLDNNTVHQMSDGEIESIFGSAENLRSLIQDRPIIEDTFPASGISTYIPLQLISGPDERVVFPNVGSRYDAETGRYIGYYSLKDAFASDETFPFDYMSLDITNDEPYSVYVTFFSKKKEGSAPVSVNVPELTEDYAVPANATGTEHIYYITIGATVHSVTAAEGVKWLGGEAPEPEAGTTLVVSVINNLAVWGTF